MPMGCSGIVILLTLDLLILLKNKNYLIYIVIIVQYISYVISIKKLKEKKFEMAYF